MMHVSLFRSPILLLTLLGVGCSTTRHIPSGDALYTGVRHIRIAADSANPPLALAVKSAVKAPLSVAPNNSLFKPYLRTPLPLGLWIYNGFYTTHTKGFRAWVFRKFSKPPVLLSSVQPQLRIHYVRELLAEYGYFEAQTGYTLLPRHNPQKVKLNYWIRAGMPWHYHSVTYPALSPAMDSVTAALWPLSPLKAGNLYNADSLVAERNRVALRLRNAGYYYFQPDFLTYLADSSQADRRVALRMILRPGVPEPALQPYRIAQVTVQLHTPSSHARPDTLSWQNGALLYQPPLRLRLRRLERLSTLRPGALLSADSLNLTLRNLNRLGIFSSVTASLPPLDSVDVAEALPIVIHATLNRPIQSDLETDFTAKSNRFLGPGLSWKVSHNNLFGGGERLTVGLKASYEWETRSNKSSNHGAALNSYELGIDASLLAGQLWAPARWRNRLPDASSEVRLGVDLLNRPRFFRLAAFDIGLTYRFSTSSRSTHALSLCQVSYNHMIHTTAAFDSTMTANPAIALSFRDQLIPTWSYTYTLTRPVGRQQWVVQQRFTSSGNLLYVLYALWDKKGEKRLFGNQFSQFIKEEVEVKFYQKIGKGRCLMAYRLMAGVGWAYGNSRVMPYSEQFYIGGANSLRAFTVRSIGPGSYHPQEHNGNSYLDQTGDFKLEANVEFRFPIMGRLHGALFVDAGNVWLLRNDPQRPGGVLDAKGFWEEIALDTGVGLRYDLSILVLRADLGIALHTPYPNPEKPHYYNISNFKEGLGFHLALGYPF